MSPRRIGLIPFIAGRAEYQVILSEGTVADEWLHSILPRIASGELLPPGYFAMLDCDSALDARDGNPEFESSWLQATKEFEASWAALEVSQATFATADDIRRESFLAVSRATKQHEIASYVSDDFELITHARIVGNASPFVEHLWAAYESGLFPVPH